VEAVEVGVVVVDPDPFGSQRRRFRTRFLERVDGRGDLADDAHGGRGRELAVGHELVEPSPGRRLRDGDDAIVERSRAIYVEQVRMFHAAEPVRALQKPRRRQRSRRIAGHMKNNLPVLGGVVCQEYGGAYILALDRLDPITGELASRMKLSHGCH
jgi:hypothetical protein